MCIGVPNSSKRDQAFAEANQIPVTEQEFELDPEVTPGQIAETFGQDNCKVKTQYKLKDWLVSR